MIKRKSRQVSRRRALRRMGAAGLALAALPVSTFARERGDGRKRTDRSWNLGWRVSVFRLKTRDTNACRSCRIHHKYVIGLSRHHMNIHRAHPGCNCPIVRQKIMRADFRRLFIDTRSIRRGYVDLRNLDQVRPDA